MSIRLVTAVEYAATAAERFRNQYRDWSREDRFSTPDRHSKGDVEDYLNSHQHTPENITTILNAAWAYPKCDCCGKFRNVVVELKEEWDDDLATLCLVCLTLGADMLRQFPNAAEEPA